MMRFNLLPHREREHRRLKAALQAAMAGAFLLGAGGAIGVWAWVQAQTAWQQARNAERQTQLSMLDAALARAAALEAEVAARRERLASLQTLSTERNRSVHLLNELAQRIPEGVHLTRMRQQDSHIALAGLAKSNAHLAELLRALDQGSAWWQAPRLGESAAASVERADGGREWATAFALTLQMRGADTVAAMEGVLP